MNWQSLVIVGIIVILFIILMIINASTADLDQDNAEGSACCCNPETAPASDTAPSTSSTTTNG